MADQTTGPGAQHPPEWRADLNPGPDAGRNAGLGGGHPEKSPEAPSAFDIKELKARLQGYSADELKQITVLPEGSRLDQGAVYIDLREQHPREIRARGDMEAGSHNWYVPKTGVDYQLWNRLIGVDNPERLGTADDA
ncbi:MAG TPA: hypothetical protein VM536_08640 [Chloroflexia bacterium]|nr:hypothetical protein [Chloroflexia bacterium]